MYKTNIEVMNRVFEHKDELERLGHDWFFISLQGSWNYNLGYENSDVDTKALILPNFRDIVLDKKAISTTHLMPNNEHLDIKDARVMFQNFWKQNINFLEILFSDYVAINPLFEKEFFELTDMAEDIARYDIKKALNCMSGMAQEKLHALEHPYPAVAADIEKYGYSPKEFHHILRMYNFMENYIDGKPFEKCLTLHSRFSYVHLMNAKRGYYSLETVREVAESVCKDIHDLKSEYLDTHETVVRTDVRAAAEDVLYRVLEKKFCNDLGV